jgi:hypothetical protein
MSVIHINTELSKPDPYSVLYRDLVLANILAAMQAGVTEFDAAIGGLGGCPYAPNAAGNILDRRPGEHVDGDGD